MIETFKESPILLLFIVSAIGYWIGTISIKGTKLGVSAVLFVGLLFGGLDEGLYVPDVIIFLGLSIFVYTIGLASGPGFFSTFKRRGFKDIYFIIFLTFLSATLTVGVHFIFELDTAVSAGLLAGAVTNTPALAGLIDLIGKNPSVELRTSLSEAAVIGYSLAYPMGVLMVMTAVLITQRIFKISFEKEEQALKAIYPVSQSIVRQTIIISQLNGMNNIRDIYHRYHRRIVFGRMESQGTQLLPNMDSLIQVGDQLVIVGDQDDVNQVVQDLGIAQEHELTYDRRQYDVRRFFVSNPDLAGEKIASLNLSEKYPIIITRVQRGDNDLIARGNTILELGDRVLVVAHRKDMDGIEQFFGNSYERLSHIDLLSFGLGMALGLLLGMIKFEFPGGMEFNLGFAGGPLLVALLLGTLRRTGPTVWTLPYSANLTLRQFGLILLLAGIGIRSGHTFLQTIMEGEGLYLLLYGAMIVFTSSFLGLIIGYKLFKIPFSLLIGMTANQPALLDFAIDRSGNKLPNIGFTLMLPIGMILKIILVQLVYALL